MLLLALVMAFATMTAQGFEPRGLLQDFAADDLVIATAGGEQRFRVRVAKTPEQRSRGLMFVQSMGEREGMIFLYPESGTIAMWMKNTFIPLDMLFVGADNRVTRVHTGAVPHSTKIISSGGAVTAVIELNAGAVARFGIRRGDAVVFPAKPPAATDSRSAPQN